MAVFLYVGADGLKMKVHRGHVGIRQDERHACIACWAYGSEDIRAFIAQIVRHAWPRSCLGPDIAQRAFCPTRASSWNQSSIVLFFACAGSTVRTMAAKFF